MPIISKEDFVKIMEGLRRGAIALQNMFEVLSDEVFNNLSWSEQSAVKAIEFLMGDAAEMFTFYYYDLGWDVSFRPQVEHFENKTYRVKDWGDFYDMVWSEYHNGENAE